MYTTCVIWLAFVPLYFGTGNNMALRITSMSVTISLSASVTVACLFSPKVSMTCTCTLALWVTSMYPSSLKVSIVCSYFPPKVNSCNLVLHFRHYQSHLPRLCAHHLSLSKMHSVSNKSSSVVCGRKSVGVRVQLVSYAGPSVFWEGVSGRAVIYRV